MPGTMPATNSCTTEVSAITAYRIIGIDGGMMTASVAADDIDRRGERRRDSPCLHAGDQDRAERGDVGHRRAGDLGEEQRRADRHMREAAADPAEQRRRRTRSAGARCPTHS